jgi:hypothetical protein
MRKKIDMLLQLSKSSYIETERERQRELIMEV